MLMSPSIMGRAGTFLLQKKPTAKQKCIFNDWCWKTFGPICMQTMRSDSLRLLKKPTVENLYGFYFKSFRSISPTKMTAHFWNIVTLKTDADNRNRRYTMKLWSNEKRVLLQKHSTWAIGLFPYKILIVCQNYFTSQSKCLLIHAKQNTFLNLNSMKEKYIWRQRTWDLKQEAPKLSSWYWHRLFTRPQAHH